MVSNGKNTAPRRSKRISKQRQRKPNDNNNNSVESVFPQLSKEQLKTFYFEYQQRGRDWNSIAAEMNKINGPTVTPQIVQHLYASHENILSRSIVDERTFLTEHEKIVGATALAGLQNSPARSSKQREQNSNNQLSKRKNTASPVKSPNVTRTAKKRKATKKKLDFGETPSSSSDVSQSNSIDSGDDVSTTPKGTPQKISGKTKQTKVDMVSLSPKPRKRKRKRKSEPLHISERFPTDSISSNLRSPISSTSQQRSLPPKLRGKRTMSTQNPQIVKPLDSSPSLNHIEQVQNLTNQLSHVVSSKARRFCICEWFYPTIDYGFFARNDFEFVLPSHLQKYSRMTRFEWNQIRAAIGQPRRLSAAYLSQTRKELEEYRTVVRKYALKKELDLNEQRKYFQPYAIPRRLESGKRVIVLDSRTYLIRTGEVVGVRKQGYKILFDGTNERATIQDVLVMSESPEIKTLSEPMKQRYLSNYRKSPPTIPTTAIAHNFYENNLSSPSLKRMRTNNSVTARNPQIISNNSATSNSNIDIVSMAHCTVYLHRKDALIENLRKTANKAENMRNETGIIDRNLADKCAWLVCQLRDVNLVISRCLDKLKPEGSLIIPSSSSDYNLNSITSPTMNIQNNAESSSSQSALNDMFREDRYKASDIVSTVVNQLSSTSGNSFYDGTINNNNNNSYSNVRDMVLECIAVICHLKTCVENDNINMGEVKVNLDAAAMGLQPKYKANQDLYLDIKSLIDRLKHLFSNPST